MRSVPLFEIFYSLTTLQFTMNRFIKKKLWKMQAKVKHKFSNKKNNVQRKYYAGIGCQTLLSMRVLRCVSNRGNTFVVDFLPLSIELNPFDCSNKCLHNEKIPNCLFFWALSKKDLFYFETAKLMEQKEFFQLDRALFVYSLLWYSQWDPLRFHPFFFEEKSWSQSLRKAFITNFVKMIFVSS